MPANSQNNGKKKEDRTSEMLKRVEDKLDRFEKNQKRFEERQDRTDARIDGLAHELKEKGEKDNARFDELARGVKQNSTDIESLRITILNLYEKQEKRAEKEQQKNAEFREEMSTIMDNMVKKYDVFDTEKKALGANVDRVQKDVDGLKTSDRKQNLAIANLKTRVDRLEADRASA